MRLRIDRLLSKKALSPQRRPLPRLAKIVVFRLPIQSLPTPEQPCAVRAFLLFRRAVPSSPDVEAHPSCSDFAYPKSEQEDNTMEITIKRYSRKLTYEDAATLDEFWELAKRTERSFDREQRRHWDGRECDEYIIAAQGVLPYCATPEELVCQQETLDEILAVLALCTPTQRERFLLYALYDFSYAEIGRRCGCSKAAVYDSIEGVRKKFFKFFR